MGLILKLFYTKYVNTLIFQHIFYAIETLGILSFALSGVLLAKRKNFDIVGVYIIAWITAFGGGTIRDVILDIQPVYWISHAEYPIMLLVLIIAMSLIKKIKLRESWLFVPDAMGVALFSITAAQTAHQAGHPLIIVAILATIVATFGGVIRDSLCQEIPTIFKKETTMYASVAFFGACLYVGLHEFAPWDSSISMIIAAIITFLSRVIANKYQLRWNV